MPYSHCPMTVVSPLPRTKMEIHSPWELINQLTRDAENTPVKLTVLRQQDISISMVRIIHLIIWAAHQMISRIPNFEAVNCLQIRLFCQNIITTTNICANSKLGVWNSWNHVVSTRIHWDYIDKIISQFSFQFRIG